MVNIKLFALTPRLSREGNWQAKNKSLLWTKEVTFKNHEMSLVCKATSRLLHLSAEFGVELHSKTCKFKAQCPLQQKVFQQGSIKKLSADLWNIRLIHYPLNSCIFLILIQLLLTINVHRANTNRWLTTQSIIGITWEFGSCRIEWEDLKAHWRTQACLLKQR